MPKIYLSPAMHRWNPCAIEGMDETTENNAYCDRLEPYLAACGFAVRRGVRRTPKSDEDGNAIMIQNVRESNEFGADLHYVSHTNAADGTVRGYRPIIYPTDNADGERLAAILLQKRSQIYDGPIQLDRRSDLYELSHTNAVAYYEEHVFHDNYNDDLWFHENMEQIARKTAEGICEYFSVPFVDPYAEGKPPDSDPGSDSHPKPPVEPPPEPGTGSTPQPEPQPETPVPPSADPPPKPFWLALLQGIIRLFTRLFQK